jgi:hypothetical protein
MSTIVLRSVKGTPLSNTEVDTNFSNLNTDKTELGGTYSAGTANGVLFLSASKVLTTGSALTFDGTNLGVGTSSPARTLDVRGFVSASDGTTRTEIVNGGGVGYFGTSTNHPLAFQTNNTEQMRLTSTGLGIGTSSPAYKLDVQSAGNTQVARFTTGGSGTSDIVAFARDDALVRAAINYNGIDGGISLWTSTNHLLAFGTNGSRQVILDTSGNLGLGVTPSAWTDYKVFQVGGAYLFGYNNDELGMGQGAYYGSGWKYSATGVPATWFSAYQGAYKFFTAPSGTAGNAISFTQAMTLDASGNLGVGTTSPSNRLHVAGAATTQLQVQMTGQADMRIISDTGYGALSLESNMPLIFRTNATERARIDSSGNLIQTVNTTAATLATNGTLTFSIVDNSTLRISVRGSDGTTRTATVALT